MKTTIVCGVLGAGKTTFLRNILKHGAEKTVVLVNDFGSVGIDGEILSSGGIETIELPSGCVCCTLRFDLITTIERIIEELKPAYLYIEPSGVASPSGVLDALGTLKLQQVAVVCVVDAATFIDDYGSGTYGWFFKSQVTRADIILVNKTDLADAQKIKDTIDLIESLNQNAVIVPTVNAGLDSRLLKYETKPVKEECVHGQTFHMETRTVRFEGPVSLESTTNTFNKLLSGEYGNVMRAKALVQTEEGPFRFDLASKQVEHVRFDHPVKKSRLVIIGKDLKEDKIREIMS